MFRYIISGWIAVLALTAMSFPESSLAQQPPSQIWVWVEPGNASQPHGPIRFAPSNVGNNTPCHIDGKCTRIALIKDLAAVETGLTTRLNETHDMIEILGKNLPEAVAKHIADQGAEILNERIETLTKELKTQAEAIAALKKQVADLQAKLP